MFESVEPVKSEGSVAPEIQRSSATEYYVTLAALLGFKRNTLHKWVMAGRLPQPLYFGERGARITPAMIEEIMAKGLQPPGTYTRTANVPALPPICPTHSVGLVCPRCSAKKTAAKKPAPKKKPITKKGGRK